MTGARRAGTGQAGEVAVIGGGTMGQGIAYAFATASHRVLVVEPVDEVASAIAPTLAARARTGVARGRLPAARADELPALLEVVPDLARLPHGLDLVIESVPEQAELKADVLRRAEALGPRVLATNTSSISIDALAGGLVRPADFLGMHFFNPVWSIALVEIVRGTATAAETLAAAEALAGSIGKETITVRDVPGFATSRLDNIAAFEAMRMLEEGVASAEDIDRAATLAYGHPIGPLRLSDVVGLDVRLDIARHLEKVYGPRYAPPEVLQDLVAEGKLGRKSGQGFFRWS
jgi:3-hydroxybutyryl-CoA dehydrogenase